MSTSPLATHDRRTSSTASLALPSSSGGSAALRWASAETCRAQGSSTPCTSSRNSDLASACSYVLVAGAEAGSGHVGRHLGSDRVLSSSMPCVLAGAGTDYTELKQTRIKMAATCSGHDGHLAAGASAGRGLHF